MNEITDRTPSIIATEINSIKDQTRNVVLFNSIEIGRRLVEVKGMIEHGQWGNWLKDSVDYSQSTANNLMRIFEEYGSKQIALFDNNAKSQALGNLSYTQAVALLGIPQEEREAFIEENDVENMSTRELQQAIKERDEAVKKEKELEKKLNDAEKSVKQIQDDRDKYIEEAKHWETKFTDTEKSLKEAQNNGSSEEEIKELEDKLKEAQGKVKELTDKLNQPVTIDATVAEKVPESVEKELEQLRELAAKAGKSESVIKFQVCFDDLVKGFSKLLGALDEIKEPEEHTKYAEAIDKLIGKMKERL